MPFQEPIFRHPDLDFASLHIYQEGTIDDPRDTVAPALAMGKIVRDALGEMPDLRPFFDSEHGPIHAYKDKHITLPEAFDDEYFRHMQWAHLASGAAGGGMRWPNRKPHVLTRGMRRAQHALAYFLPLIDWPSFRRVNLNHEVEVSDPNVAAFACGDARQALVWLLRKDTLGPDGMIRRDAAASGIDLRIPGLHAGRYSATLWDTAAGLSPGSIDGTADDVGLALTLPRFTADIALAVSRR
jgi:mannan endo-1,4-beta-mannosidase